MREGRRREKMEGAEGGRSRKRRREGEEEEEEGRSREGGWVGEGGEREEREVNKCSKRRQVNFSTLKTMANGDLCGSFSAEILRTG